jgi:multidrug resistance efflux pump
MTATTASPQEPVGEAPAPEPAAAAPPRAKNPLRRTALIVVAVALVLFALSVVMERLVPSTSQAVVQAYIVRMAPEVGGRVIEIAVTDNAMVRQGDLLFLIDPRPYELAVAEAEARLDIAGQAIGASTSAVDSAQARLVEVMADRDNVREQAARVFELVERGVYPAARYDQAKALLDSAEAAVVGAEADLEQARQQLGPEGADNPQLREALAALEQARLDLLHTRVVAPADGVVSNLQLAIGQVVGPGQAAMTFIDAGTIWIAAAYKENSLEHMAIGESAEVVFDIFPGAVYPAKVESIGWGVSQGSIDPATGLPSVRNESGWVREPQRFPVRLTFVGDRPIGIRYGSQVNVVVFAQDNALLNALGWFWIRLISVLSYVT